MDLNIESFIPYHFKVTKVFNFPLDPISAIILNNPGDYLKLQVRKRNEIT